MNLKTFPSTNTNILKNPDGEHPPLGRYKPVDCDFTDDLEFVCIKKIEVEVRFWKQNSLIGKSIGWVKDIVTENQEEFLIMSNRERIRLDCVHDLKILNS